MGTNLIIAALAIFSLCFLLRSFDIFLHYKRYEAALKSDTSLFYGVWAAAFTGLIACFTSYWWAFFLGQACIMLGISLYNIYVYKNNMNSSNKLERTICWLIMFVILWGAATCVTIEIL